MKLGDLTQIIYNSSCIKVKSAYDGRTLIHQYNPNKHKKFNELRIVKAYVTMAINDRITEIDASASAVLVCSVNETEYKRLKEIGK